MRFESRRERSFLLHGAAPTDMEITPPHVPRSQPEDGADVDDGVGRRDEHGDAEGRGQ